MWLLGIAVPLGATAAGGCPEIPPEQLNPVFPEPVTQHLRETGQRVVSLEIPASFEGAAFRRMEVVYRNASGSIYRFPVAVNPARTTGKLDAEIWLPRTYAQLEIVASYQATRCLRLLNARFVGRERVR